VAEQKEKGRVDIEVALTDKRTEKMKGFYLESQMVVKREMKTDRSLVSELVCSMVD
jgi:hypothetical protein